ncbi:hypothetical protein [Sedimenticola thiotaurini]|uniref:Uncharacterized protein n=1 Tax=Sedimenticola thiotaurini TaxID=1543721 RepID=A0A0F7JZ43_9GAMM|nr:hypothetical protein [Sedimenticola thiotaurini]AKH20992.1 hypothetical protein AAY24_12245 [Sedimenticola thiotaurini]
MRKFILALSLVSLNLHAASSGYTGTGIPIQGAAAVTTENLFSCEYGRSRLSPVGVKSAAGKRYVVPGQVNYKRVNFAADLYNQCNGVTPDSMADVPISDVPVVEIDPDGQVITGYIFADNYFELYVNGKLVGVDPVPFTPFNSNIVRFKVNKPYEIAVKVVDWEEHSGLGSEQNRGKPYHPGDGGFIASFSDGTVTSPDWYAQTYYTAPIYDLTCVEEVGSQRGSQKCSTEARDDASNAYSLHWDIPANWQTSGDYSDWPKATGFTEDHIGVNNKNAYMNFREKFTGAGASFIWSSNVVLDNLVLLRHRVE